MTHTQTFNPLFRQRGVRLQSDEEPDDGPRERSVSESRVIRTLPLASDLQLRDAVVNVYGDLRFGVLLEYLDAMAGNVAYRHVGPAGRALTIVTAACDRIRLQRPLTASLDLELRGSVAWTGRSSMAVVVDVASLDPPRGNNSGSDNGNRDSGDSTERGRTVLLRSLFTMVARNPVTDRAARVPSLRPENDGERALFDAVAAYAGRNREARARSLYRVSPSPDELELVHRVFTAAYDPHKEGVARARPASWIPMKDTEMHSTLLMVPQDRNIHNKVFGGYLMRAAFELAFITAQSFLGDRPEPLGVDDVNFLYPVEIGDVLKLSALVACTSASRGTMQVRVAANVLDPRTKEQRTTNVFHFAFRFPDDAAAAATRVVPVTYEEAIWFLMARRETVGSDDVDSAVLHP